MSDKDIPTSGSRWEPADDASGEPAPQPAGAPAGPPTVPVEPAAAEHAAIPADDHDVQAQYLAGPPESGSRPHASGRLRRRSGLAAAGVGLVLGGGLGGFAIGHAIAGTDGSQPDISTGADQGGIPDGDRSGRPHVDGNGGGPGAPDGSSPDGSTPDGSASGDGDGGTA